MLTCVSFCCPSCFSLNACIHIGLETCMCVFIKVRGISNWQDSWELCCVVFLSLLFEGCVCVKPCFPDVLTGSEVSHSASCRIIVSHMYLYEFGPVIEEALAYLGNVVQNCRLIELVVGFPQENWACFFPIGRNWHCISAVGPNWN